MNILGVWQTYYDVIDFVLGRKVLKERKKKKRIFIVTFRGLEITQKSKSYTK